MKISDLLEKVLKSTMDNTNEADGSIPTDGNSTRKRKTATSPSRKPQPAEPDYTPEQLQHVKRIQRYKRNHFTKFAQSMSDLILLLVVKITTKY